MRINEDNKYLSRAEASSLYWPIFRVVVLLIAVIFVALDTAHQVRERQHTRAIEGYMAVHRDPPPPNWNWEEFAGIDQSSYFDFSFLAVLFDGSKR